MRILFSPIGTADPMTMLGDGPMLHIVRHRAPDRILLLLSPKMAQYQEKDARYTGAIELLIERERREAPQVELIESNIENEDSWRYDLYISEFEEYLSRLRQENPEAEIYVNVTSGTPAMEAALVALDAFGRYDLTAIQVTTPRKDLNAAGDREDPNKYDLETLWSLNLDNTEGREDRCNAVRSENFMGLIIRDNVKSLVSGYDYVGAHQLGSQSNAIPEQAKLLIEGCMHRMRLDVNRTGPCFRGFAGTPLVYSPSEKLAEYLAMMEVYLLREQWSDYLRALSPAFFEILSKSLEKFMPKDYWLKPIMDKDTKKIVYYRLDENKINNSPQLSSALSGIRYDVKPIVNSNHICILLEHYLSPKEFKPYGRLRKMEERARNTMAHEITRVDKNSLERSAGMGFEESMNLLFKLGEATAKRGLYTRINQEILKLL